MSSALISIITPSYNRAAMIAGAIESVLAQDFPDVEHIIVDGGSQDGTPDILRRYPHLKVIAGPDRGIYDALNKGLEHASGGIIGFLNSDDYYVPGVFGTAAGLLASSGADAVAGQADYVTAGKLGSQIIFRRSVALTPGAFWHEITYGEPAFNAWFFDRRVFDKIGQFDIAYRIAGDRDFLLRFALSNLRCQPLEETVYCYRAHPDSLSMTSDLLKFSQVANENLRLVDRYLPLLPSRAQADMQRIRTRDTITAASRNLRGGAYGAALHYAGIGIRYNPAWPVEFVLRVFQGLLKVLRRAFSGLAA